MTTLYRTQPGALTERDQYFFDLYGYVIVKNALTPAQLTGCNAIIDGLQHLRPGDWSGYVHGHSYGAKDGLNLQQIYEAGAVYEELIDNPAWIEKVKCFVGGEGTFDWSQGPLYIDECFASVRGRGQAIPMHSGGHEHVKRIQFLCRDQQFMCGQVNVLTALYDVGPGDGATMVIPGSHKANFRHPDIATQAWGKADSMEGVEGAVEVHLKAGESLIFVDQLMHGSAARVNDGQRRILIYRYGPSWGGSRNGYQPSEELLARLNPERRSIVRPQAPLLPPKAAARVAQPEPVLAH
jgi:ectoine hydroxylase-related dioxygenase (phytanoyl-CoA dioxygenase family)